MKKSGKYALYGGNEYMLNKDMDGNNLIITKNKDYIDNSFIDVYGNGIYSKKIELTQLDEIYSITIYGYVDGEKVSIIKEKDGKYLIGTSDCKIGEKLKLDRVDKYGYEGWVSSSDVQIFEEKNMIGVSIK